MRTGDYGCVRCIVDFLAAGSDRKTIGELVNAADNRRCSALHMAAGGYPPLASFTSGTARLVIMWRRLEFM